MMCILIGPVHLMKSSIASSSREKRNAKKRSFEQSMSATATKILKMEQEKDTEDNEVNVLQQGSVNRAHSNCLCSIIMYSLYRQTSKIGQLEVSPKK